MKLLASILSFLLVLVGLIIVIVKLTINVNKARDLLARKNSKISQLEEQIAEKENDKVFKIKDDGTIVRVDETCPDNNDITYCPYCGKKLK